MLRLYLIHENSVGVEFNSLFWWIEQFILIVLGTITFV